MNETIIETDKTYLSEIMTELPSGVLLNKGVTGCGGTYVELHSPRNSIILVPTVELVKNKSKDGFIVYAQVKEKDIERYLASDIPHKKIIATYDALNKIINLDLTDYFLLIDEYHILFNSYAYRNDAILFLLKNYNKFLGYCFMTATPLNNDIILDEIKHLPRISIHWTRAIPIKLNIIDTAFTSKALLKILIEPTEYNYHIFLNSVRTIRDIVTKSGITDYKIVCSESSKTNIKTLKVGSTLDPPCKYNFYTATAFEGCDIYDPIGKTIILSDTNISTTVLDISTLIRQISGRLRDSKFKNEITLILNTSKHRYVGTSETIFKANVEENIKMGKYREQKFKEDPDDLFRQTELKLFNKETWYSMYLNKIKNEIFYDDNLRKVDEYNYKLISEIYKNTISVICEAEQNGFTCATEEPQTSWIEEKLENREYTYLELEELFKEDFLKLGIEFSGITLKDYFPSFTKTRKTRNKMKETYYKFKF